MLRTSLTIALAAALLAACSQKSEPQGAQTEAGAGAPPPAPETPAQPAAPMDARTKALLAELPAPYSTGDVENGRRVFARCQVCHSTAEGGPNLIGPNLWGVFGRKVASKSDFAYSDDLKSKSWTWDAPHIDAWIANPRQIAPGTKMSFAGLADPKDRTDVIAYLKTATTK